MRLFPILLTCSLLSSLLPACAPADIRPASAAPSVVSAKTAAAVASPAKAAKAAKASADAEREAGERLASEVSAIARAADLPLDLSDELALAARIEGPLLAAELSSVLSGDSSILRLVDKVRPLPSDYVPADLVPLTGGAYVAGRTGMVLRQAASDSLEAMAAAARADGVPLTVSSAYRSFGYQKAVRDRVEAELGTAAADRESARAGHSQHQLGLAVDFGSIDDSFAQTKASAWLKANAARWGWSLSYPEGLEAVTGYRWESWHYRWIGAAASSLIERRFRGVQQYGLAFLDAWKAGKR